MNSEDPQEREEIPLMPEETLLQEITPISPDSSPEIEIKETPPPIPVVTKQYLKAVTQMATVGDRYFFTDGESRVEVMVISDEIIRVRLAPQGEFLEEFSYALSENKFHVTKSEASETDEHFIVATNAVSCRISKSDFHISFYNTENVLLNEDVQPMHWEENVQFGGYYVFCSKGCQEEEHFIGLGDKPMKLDLMNSRLQNWGTDAFDFARGTDPLYKNIPFYVGTHHGLSYGIFFDNTYRTFFDFAHEEKDKVSFWSDGGEMQYYFIAGPQMMDVVKRYSQLTGTHPMTPKWSLGFQQSRWSYFPDKKVRTLAKTFREKKIPCDAIHFDIDYMEGFRCFTWNKKYFPNPKKLIGDLHQQGFKSVAIIDPGIKVDDSYWVFKEGKENKYFCRRGDDYFLEGKVWPGRCQFPDFTNPKVREWWGGLFKEYVEQGILGIWNDMNEPAVFGTPTKTFPIDARHHYDGLEGSHRKGHNVYGMQMVRATYEGMKKLQNNKRPFIITRSGYSGVQRYSSTWTGDNKATWDHLKLAIQMLQRLNVSGIPFCGSDIGGFTGEPDGELYARWIQLGVFSPFMRVHSSGDTRPREPWAFGAKTEKIVKKFIELRYKLIPYIYSVFWEHVRYNSPMLRPLALIEQEVVENFQRDDIFCYGDKILVAPIVEQGATSRDVYFPKGLWYSFQNFESYEGGKSYSINAPLDTLPMFIKAGSVIPESPVMQYVNEFEPEEMTLNVYYAPYHSTSLLFEDDGNTFEYLDGNYAERKFETQGNENLFVIQQTIEGKFASHYENYHIRLYGIPFHVARVIVDGKEIKFRHAKNTAIISFAVTKNFTRIEIA